MSNAVIEIVPPQAPATSPDAQPATAEDRSLRAPAERTVAIDPGLLTARGLHPNPENIGRHRDEYRKLRREVIDAMRSPRPGLAPRNRRVVVLTSALPGDGKSYTSMSLALSIARQGTHPVVLVDGDTIKQTITEALDLSGTPGLIEALASPESDPKRLLLPTSMPQLQVLPAGNRTDEAAELFSNERLGAVFGALHERARDVIFVIDTPPILLSSDTQEMTDLAEQVLLVVRAGVSLQDSVKDAAGRIRENIPVGVILNGWEPTVVSERRAYYAYDAYSTYKPGK